MPMPERRALITGGLLLTAAALVPVIEPHRLLARELPPLRLESDVPRSFGAWHVDETIYTILPSPDVQAQLDKVYNQQLSRTYINAAGDRIMLVIAYGEDQVGKTTVAHLPDACYPAQGFTVTSRPPRPVHLGARLLGVARLVANKTNRHEPITYWTAVGRQTFSSDADRRWIRLGSAIEGVIPDGMLVRISSIDRDEEHAFSVQDDFIRALNSALSDSVRARVFGRSA